MKRLLIISFFFLLAWMEVPDSAQAQGNVKAVCSQGDQQRKPQKGDVLETDDGLWYFDGEIWLPIDPNEIVGPDGWVVYTPAGDTLRWVSYKQQLSYTIYFENDSTRATAAAQMVSIQLPLDTLLDLGAFGIGSFGFGNRVFPVVGSPLQLQHRLDLTVDRGIYVDVVAGLDITRGRVFWIFQTIDPTTGLPPEDVNAGFLPVNDTAGSGEGFVTFVISPRSEVCHTGDSIAAQATIVFDINDPITTNRWLNYVDAQPPVSTASQVNTLAGDSIHVAFSGTDDTTGIAQYRLYCSINGGSFAQAGSYNPGEIAAVAADPNRQYSFFSLTVDNAGNIEPVKDTVDFVIGNPRVRLTASAFPDTAATVTITGSGSGGYYDKDSTVVVTAQAAEGYRFVRWTAAGATQGSEPLLTMTAREDMELVALMERSSYPLTIDTAEGAGIHIVSRSQGSLNSGDQLEHFDTLDITITASQCHTGITHMLNGTLLANDTVLVVRDTLTLSSAATPLLFANQIEDTVCPNNDYSSNGFNILSSATQNPGNLEFQITSTNTQGCDSTTTLHLNVRESHAITFMPNGGSGSMPTQQVCHNENSILASSAFSREGYNFAGWATTEEGDAVYMDGDMVALSADITLYALWSINCVNLTASRIATACDSYRWNDSTFTAPGEYQWSVENAVPGGCDSIYHLFLTINHSSASTQREVALLEYTWIDGETYTEDTVCHLTLVNAVNCDSIVTLRLTIIDENTLFSVTGLSSDELMGTVTGSQQVHYPDNVTLTATAAEGYHFMGWTDMQNQPVSEENPLAVLPYGDTTLIAVFAPNAYTVALVTDNNVATVSGDGTYNYGTTVTITTSPLSQCHNFIGWMNNETIMSTDAAFTFQITGDVTLTAAYEAIMLTGDTTAVACDQFDWYDHTGLTTSSENLTHLFENVNEYGCDSTVTLHLTVNYSSVGDTTAVACDQFDWYEHTDLTTNSDNLTHLFENANAAGCDSTVTLHLTVYHPEHTAVTDTACGSYEWNGTEYPTSGDWTYGHADANGCMQVDTLHLVIFNSITFPVAANLWYAISSPMHSYGNNQAMRWVGNLTGGIYDLFRYNESEGRWEHPRPSDDAAAGVDMLERGRGYIYRNADDVTLSFCGQPNNGSFAYTGIGDVDNLGDITYGCSDADLRGFHLVGNPYPHKIYKGVGLVGGGLTEGYYTLQPNGSWLARLDTAAIEVGQAVLLKATEPTTLYFYDDSDAPAFGTNSTFTFAVTDGQHSDVAYAMMEKNGKEKHSKRSLMKIGHIGVGLPLLYITQEGSRYSIAMLDDEVTEFPLVFRGNSGDYTLSMRNDKSKGLNYIHLIDLQDGKDVDLLSHPEYSFKTNGTSRFLVRLVPESTADRDDHFAYIDGDRVVIDVNQESLPAALQIYDVLGRLLFNYEIRNTKIEIQNSEFPATGVYVLRLGERSQKIVIK